MNPLEILRLVLLVAHFVGLAAIIGPFLLQMRRREGFVVTPMLVGAVVQIGTGMGLIATRRLTGLDVIDEKMITKFTLAVLVVLFATLAWRRQRLLPDVSDSPIRPLLLGAGLTGIADVVVAVVWV